MFKFIFRLFNLIPFWKMFKYVPGVGFVDRKIEDYKHKTNKKVEKLREAAVRGGFIILVAGIVLWIAIFMYIAFYYTYMPSLSHIRPVNLQFKSCDSHDRSVCSFPTAHVQLTKRQNLLMVGQSYKVYIHLDVPESEVNKQQGMFMVCLQMHDKHGTLIANSCRTVMLHYRSWLLHTIRTLVFSPLMVMGSYEEKQRLTVEMFSEFEEDQARPVTDAYIEIQSKKLELYGATMHIHAHFTGLRYLMFHWPILSAVVGINGNLFFIILVAALSYYNLNHPDGRANRYTTFIKAQFESSAEYFFQGKLNDEEEEDSEESIFQEDDGSDIEKLKSLPLEAKRSESASSTDC